MIYPHTISIYRDDATALAYDAESGYPTTVPAAVSVYAGEAFVQDDERVLERNADGDIMLASDAVVYLPPGSWGVAVDDRLTVTGAADVDGQILRVSKFRETFYTKLMVKWNGA